MLVVTSSFLFFPLSSFLFFSFLGRLLLLLLLVVVEGKGAELHPGTGVKLPSRTIQEREQWRERMSSPEASPGSVAVLASP